jgi:hypothetical protein
MVVIHSIL